MKNLQITPLSVIRRPNLRRVDISCETDRAAHYILHLYKNDTLLLKTEFAHPGGSRRSVLWLDLPGEDFPSRWHITDLAGNTVADVQFVCKAPREWTFYVMVSSHTDIGLHNSQYHQRYHSSRMVDEAMKLCDETEHLPEESRYRYVLEGSWVFNNYLEDRTVEQKSRLLDYIHGGKIGVCAGVAGNHTQTYGLEELCRSAENRKWLADRGVETKTMSMIDNNGMSWSLVQPYADAGYENILFSPNHWNPLPSTLWKCEYQMPGFIWNTDAGGGGARVDVSYDSALPMLFWWEGKYGERLLVWSSVQYDRGGLRFGIASHGEDTRITEDKMAANLPLLEEKYPYDIWLMASYSDDQFPSLGLQNKLTEWNNAYAWPKLRMLGNPDEPFDIVREKYGDVIPTLRGDITGGWYQHPAAAAELLARKMNADRALANAEKIASVAAVYADYTYPTERFGRAWAGLVMNDEHSYGTSGYQGRRVYETWMGHRDWIEKAERTSAEEAHAAVTALAGKIAGKAGDVLVFNPIAKKRRERVEARGICMADLPAFGWTVLPAEQFCMVKPKVVECIEPPVVENAYYRLRFAENGAIAEIFDKELGRILNHGSCNEMLYTTDNHQTFHAPEKASFTVTYGWEEMRVDVITAEPVSGADLHITVTLPAWDKRIDIENHLTHVRDMVNTDRYYRYLYFAFPFDVANGKRICELGGSEAEYGVDITGHGTDVYMAAHEYCAVDSAEGWGVGLVQLDSQLMEFDHIHPDKTDFGNPGSGSAMYAYISNDWLQMHLPGGSALDYRLRYTITSYAGDHYTAGLETLAERLANPPYVHILPAHPDAVLPENKELLASNGRLVGLHRASDGKGLAARIYSQTKPEVTCDWTQKGTLQAGFSTITLGEDQLTIPVRPVEVPDSLTIGGVETGLITKPQAACGENDGMLYLLWGKCSSDKLSHYDLYRGECADFPADDSTKIAQVTPEEFVVGRYIDTGLETNKRYFYRVQAVDADGNRGALSEVFSALTKESLQK